MCPVPQVTKQRRTSLSSSEPETSPKHVSIEASQQQKQHLPSCIIVLELEINLLSFGNPPRIIFYFLYLSPAEELNEVFEKKIKVRSMTYSLFSIQWGRDSCCPRLWC